MEALRKAYVGKDSSALESLMLPLDPLERVQREAQNDFDNFQEIDLEFSIERILIDGENIDVFVHWQGQWKKVSTDSGLRQRGHAQLQWVGVQSILLRGVQGDLPFGIGARQTISEPPSENRKGP